MSQNEYTPASRSAYAPDGVACVANDNSTQHNNFGISGSDMNSIVSALLAEMRAQREMYERLLDSQRSMYERLLDRAAGNK